MARFLVGGKSGAAHYASNVSYPNDLVLMDAAGLVDISMLPAAVIPNAGQATVPFATWLSEDSVKVNDAGIIATSAINLSVYADNDDVYAQDWHPPFVYNIVPGVSFDVYVRPALGLFKGPVKINWSWT